MKKYIKKAFRKLIMEEKRLLELALFCSIIGIFIILIISERIEADVINIGKINSSLNEKEVKILGEISKVRETPGLFILEVKDQNNSIKTIVFKEDNLKLKKGDMIEVTGEVKEYKGETEIDASEIKILEL